jgi:hypothetical protein
VGTVDIFKFIVYNLYMNQIYINPREHPICSKCDQSNSWVIRQKLVRSSEMIRVDGLGDIECKSFDPNSYEESIILVCSGCGESYQPQSGLTCTSERADTPEAYDPCETEAWTSRFNNNSEF